MKAVAPDPGLGEPPGNGEKLCERRLAAVKGGVEAGYLGNVRRGVENRLDGRKVMRLVQRRQRDISLELGHHGMIDQHRPRPMSIGELKQVQKFFRRGRDLNERHMERVRNLEFD